MASSGSRLAVKLLRSVFARPLTQLEYASVEIRALVSRPLRTALIAAGSALLGVVAYAWSLDTEGFLAALTGPLATSEMVALVPLTPLTPAVMGLAALVGLAVTVLLGVNRRMTDPDGSDDDF